MHWQLRVRVAAGAVSSANALLRAPVLTLEVANPSILKTHKTGQAGGERSGAVQLRRNSIGSYRRNRRPRMAQKMGAIFFFFKTRSRS
jgi:hypothetical protein